MTGVILKIDLTGREERSLDGLRSSMPVEFTLVVDSGHSYAEAIRVHQYESLEQEPLRARRPQPLVDLGQTV